MEVLYNFNTSNVFIYHMAEWTGYPPEDNFNTSNVFIYLKNESVRHMQVVISIHLMFLFIQRISAILYFHYSHFP